MEEISDDLDVDELAANGEKHASDSGAFYAWRFHFDDLPELNIEYMPFDGEDEKLRCWGTIRGGSARALGGGTGERDH